MEALVITICCMFFVYLKYRLNALEKKIDEMQPRLNQIKGLYSKIEELKPKGDTNE